MKVKVKHWDNFENVDCGRHDGRWEQKLREKRRKDFIEGGRFGTFVLYTRRRQATQKREKQGWKEILKLQDGPIIVSDCGRYFVLIKNTIGEVTLFCFR